MIYLSGSVHLPAADIGCGFMLTPSMGQLPPEGSSWAADSGCFNRATYVGDEAYLAWLAARAGDSDRCLFATVPDVVGDHDATLAIFRPLAQQIDDLGYPVAFVAQDGASIENIPWDAIDALFIGGSTGWKLSEDSFELVAEGKRRQRWVHVGRVNSLRRLRAFAHAGADSTDGTFLAFGPDANLPRLAGWLDYLHANMTLGRES